MDGRTPLMAFTDGSVASEDRNGERAATDAHAPEVRVELPIEHVLTDQPKSEFTHAIVEAGYATTRMPPESTCERSDASTVADTLAVSDDADPVSSSGTTTTEDWVHSADDMVEVKVVTEAPDAESAACMLTASPSWSTRWAETR